SADLSQQQPGRYIVLFAAEQVPPDFAERVATLGGSVETSLDGIGVATITGLSRAGAAELAGGSDVQAVEPDRVVTLKPDGVDDGGASIELTPSETTPAPADATASPTAAQLYARQWNMRAVFADQAWAAGHRGSRDVVVALLDSGLDYTLPDFDGLVDLSRSRSFTPDEDPIVAERFPGRLPISDLFSHGTAVASVIGSKGTILAGVNQDVTLIAVKVFNRLNEGSVAQLLAGLVYAADQGADVINMSLGDTFDRRKDRASVAAVNRATNYAFRKGAVLVASSGNDAAELDHNGDVVVLPCEAPHVICVSATGPAALLVAQLGHGKPGRIRSRILHSADDLGAPGKDPYYGWGRINIARALGLLGGIDRDDDEDKADESRVVVMGHPNRKE